MGEVGNSCLDLLLQVVANIWYNPDWHD